MGGEAQDAHPGGADGRVPIGTAGEGAEVCPVAGLVAVAVMVVAVDFGFGEDAGVEHAVVSGEGVEFVDLGDAGAAGGEAEGTGVGPLAIFFKSEGVALRPGAGPEGGLVGGEGVDLGDVEGSAGEEDPAVGCFVAKDGEVGCAVERAVDGHEAFKVVGGAVDLADGGPCVAVELVAAALISTVHADVEAAIEAGHGEDALAFAGEGEIAPLAVGLVAAEAGHADGGFGVAAFLGAAPVPGAGAGVERAIVDDHGHDTGAGEVVGDAAGVDPVCAAVPTVNLAGVFGVGGVGGAGVEAAFEGGEGGDEGVVVAGVAVIDPGGGVCVVDAEVDMAGIAE